MKIDIWQNWTLSQQCFGMHKVNMHTPFKFDYFYAGTNFFSLILYASSEVMHQVRYAPSEVLLYWLLLISQLGYSQLHERTTPHFSNRARARHEGHICSCMQSWGRSAMWSNVAQSGKSHTIDNGTAHKSHALLWVCSCVAYRSATMKGFWIFWSISIATASLNYWFSSG